MTRPPTTHQWDQDDFECHVTQKPSTQWSTCNHAQTMQESFESKFFWAKISFAWFSQESQDAPPLQGLPTKKGAAHKTFSPFMNSSTYSILRMIHHCNQLASKPKPTSVQKTKMLSSSFLILCWDVKAMARQHQVHTNLKCMQTLEFDYDNLTMNLRQLVLIHWTCQTCHMQWEEANDTPHD